MTEPAHLGKKISRIRELRGMKQETLAEQLGISQQSVSKIEQSEAVEDLMLDRIAKALGVTSSAIRNFSEELAINIINNTFNDNAVNMNYQCTFNPLEKYIEVMEENKKLYEALLKSERDKVMLLEKVLEKLEKK